MGTGGAQSSRAPARRVGWSARVTITRFFLQITWAFCRTRKSIFRGSTTPTGMLRKTARSDAAAPLIRTTDEIARTKPEFILALGRHIDMPEYFRYLVDTGIPFLMEKPWGVDAETVNGLADYAENKKAWVAVPMSMRYSWWAKTAREMVRNGTWRYRHAGAFQSARRSALH